MDNTAISPSAPSSVNLAPPVLSPAVDNSAHYYSLSPAAAYEEVDPLKNDDYVNYRSIEHGAQQEGIYPSVFHESENDLQVNPYATNGINNSDDREQLLQGEGVASPQQPNFKAMHKAFPSLGRNKKTLAIVIALALGIVLFSLCIAVPLIAILASRARRPHPMVCPHFAPRTTRLEYSLLNGREPTNNGEAASPSTISSLIISGEGDVRIVQGTSLSSIQVVSQSIDYTRGSPLVHTTLRADPNNPYVLMLNTEIGLKRRHRGRNHGGPKPPLPDVSCAKSQSHVVYLPSSLTLSENIHLVFDSHSVIDISRNVKLASVTIRSTGDPKDPKDKKKQKKKIELSKLSISNGDLRIDSNGHSIELNKVNVLNGNLVLSTTHSGDIRIEDVHVNGRSELKTVQGDISVEDLVSTQGSSLTSASGNQKFELEAILPVGAKTDMRSDSGSLSASLFRYVGRFEASSTNGEVQLKSKGYHPYVIVRQVDTPHLVSGFIRSNNPQALSSQEDSMISLVSRLGKVKLKVRSDD